MMKTSFELHLKHLHELISWTFAISFNLPFNLLMYCSIWHMELDKFLVIHSFLNFVVIEKGNMLLHLALGDSEYALHGFLITINLLTKGT